MRTSWWTSWSWWSWRDRAAVPAALIVPVALCAGLVPLRSDVPNTDAALTLVVAVVAVAAIGNRIAGLLASVSAAISFDFFLTSPYERLSITDRGDVETTVLVLIVGAAVTELAVRGRRSRQLALTDARYLDAIQSVRAVAESKASRHELIAEIARQLTDLLELRSCRFEANRFGGLPRLEHDGRLRVGESYWDVDQYGMPDRTVELLASVSGQVHGRLLLEPTPGVIPSRDARRCAVVLVSQLAAVLGAYRQVA